MKDQVRQLLKTARLQKEALTLQQLRVLLHSNSVSPMNIKHIYGRKGEQLLKILQAGQRTAIKNSRLPGIKPIGLKDWAMQGARNFVQKNDTANMRKILNYGGKAIAGTAAATLPARWLMRDTATPPVAPQASAGPPASSTPAKDLDIPPELTAGAGGAAAGGAAGYALAPTLGISRTTGTIGGAALTGIAAALLAHKLKGSGDPPAL